MTTMRKTLVLVLAFVLISSVMTPITAHATTRGPRINATVAVVMDYETGEILYSRDPHNRRPPASMAKTLTAFIVYEEIESGNITLECMVRVSEYASYIARGGNNVQGNHVRMTAGLYHTVDTLLQMTMLPSSNGASVALAEFIAGTEEAFVERMNETARSLGMYADFRNSHGATVMYTTAYSIALLSREFIKRYPDILRITSMEYLIWEGSRTNNTNLFTRRDSRFHNPNIDGLKTGVIRETGWGHSVTEYRNGRRVIAVLQNSNSNDGRHNDALELLNYGFRELERREAARARELAARVHVNLDGRYLEFDVLPRMIDGHVMVPIRTIFEELGVELRWCGETMSAWATTPAGDTLIIPINSYTVFFNDVHIDMDVPIQLINGRTIAPLRVISETMGREVRWDRNTRTVHIGPVQAVMPEVIPEAQPSDYTPEDGYISTGPAVITSGALHYTAPS